MAGEKYIEVGGRLHSIATGNVLAGANEIIDDEKEGKKQSDINTETDAALEDRYTKDQTYSKSELNNMITTPNQKYVSVTATAQTTAVTDVLSAPGEADTVYRVGNWDGSQYDPSVYSEYAWNGSQYVHLSTKTQIGEVFDISAYHATGGTLATYADLSAALDSNNGGGVPQSLQKGGMSVKFVQSSDNKYVQFRFMLSGSFTAAQFAKTANWQGVDISPVANGKNLIMSKAVAANTYPFAQSDAGIPIKDIFFSSYVSKELTLYRIVRRSNIHIIELKNENNNSIYLLWNESSSYSEPNIISFNTGGYVGKLYINWGLIPSNDEIRYDAQLSKSVFDVNEMESVIHKSFFPFGNTNLPIKNIVFSSYVSNKLEFKRITRQSSLHVITVTDEDNHDIHLVNDGSSAYTEPSHISFNVSGYKGTLDIDWSEVPMGTTQFYYVPIQKSVFNLTDVYRAPTNDYPFIPKNVVPNELPIFDIWFKQYDNTKKYKLVDIGRGTYDTPVHYVRISDGNTSYLLLNELSSRYVEKIENQFNVNGLVGTFWIDWSKISNGASKTYNMPFSDAVYPLSDTRTKAAGGDVISVLPSTIYGVVGHPFSIYYYTIFQKDSLVGYHIDLSYAAADIENRGDSIHFSCASAGSRTLDLRLCKDDDSVLYSKSLTINVIEDNIPSIKALFIGDSFIADGSIQAELKHLMGDNLTLYGTLNTTTLDSTGTARAIPNEGRGGWGLNDYLTKSEYLTKTNAFWDGQKFDFSYYMQQNPSFNDVTDVFILSGPNDGITAAATYITYYQAIVDSIKAYSSSIRVHCMMPLTCVCDGYAWGVRNYGRAEGKRYSLIGFGNGIIDTFTGQSGCYVIPTHAYFAKEYNFPTTEVAVNERTPTLMKVFNDNVHPNKYGYFSMADMVYADIIANCN